MAWESKLQKKSLWTAPVEKSMFSKERVSRKRDDGTVNTLQKTPVGLTQGHNFNLLNLKPSVQAKLTVGAPGDKYEQEADNMAFQVMSMPDSAVQRMAPEEQKEEEVQTKPLAAGITPLVQREAMPEQEEVQTKPMSASIQRETSPEEEEVQTKPSLQRATDGSFQAGGNIESQLNNSKGGGTPLSDEVRGFMEPRFGADFSSVRVHTGNEAVQMNRELGAQAFTHGSDVYFGAGKAPGNNELTAHELTHVVQQTGSKGSKQDALDLKIHRQQGNETPTIQDAASHKLVQPGQPAASNPTANKASNPEAALATLLAALVGTMKKAEKGKHKFEINRKIPSYATLKSVSPTWELSLEVEPKGAAVSASYGRASSLSREGSLRQPEVNKRVELATQEVKVKLTDIFKKLFDVNVPDVDLKWAEEEAKGEEIKGAIDVSMKFSNGVTGGFKVDLYKFNLKDPFKSKIGTISPYGGWQGELPIITVRVEPLDSILFPPIAVKGKGKVTAEFEILPNNKEIVAAFVKKFGPQLAERVAMATGEQGVRIASRFTAGLKALTGVPAALIVGGLLTTLSVLDAFVEGDRAKNLGELGQRLPFVFAGGFIAEKTGEGQSGGAGGDSMVAQFVSAGSAAAKKLKQEALAEAKQKAQLEGAIVSEADLTAALNQEFKQKPLGFGDIVPIVKKQVDDYIMQQYIKRREGSLSYKGMSRLMSLGGVSLPDVKDSQEFKNFQRAYFKAYTTDESMDIVKDKAVKDLRDEGKEINDATLREYFERKALLSEKSLNE